MSGALLIRLSEYYHSIQHKPLSAGAASASDVSAEAIKARSGSDSENSTGLGEEWDAHALSSALSLSPAITHELMTELYHRFLSALSLFRGCSDRFLGHLITKCYTRHYRVADTLVAHGAPNHFVFALLSGNVEVREEQVMYGTGTFFGEANVMFVSPPASRTSFVAATDVEAVLIHVADLRYALALYPGDRELVEERIRKKNDYKLGADEKHLIPANVNGSGVATSPGSGGSSSGSGANGTDTTPPNSGRATSPSVVAAAAAAAAQAGLCVPTEHVAIHVHHSSLAAAGAADSVLSNDAVMAGSSASKSGQSVHDRLLRPFPASASSLTITRSGVIARLRVVWHMILVWAIIGYWVILPLMFAYNSVDPLAAPAVETAAVDYSLTSSEFWRLSWVHYVFDAVLIVDMALNCCRFPTAAVMCGQLPLDVIAVFPFDVLLVLIHPTVTPLTLILGRLNRLLLVVSRLPSHYESLHSSVYLTFATWRVWKLGVAVVLGLHWCACLFLASATEHETVSWVNERQALIADQASFGLQYVYALYWGVSTLTHTAFGDVVSARTEEMGFTIAAVVVGSLLYALVVGSLLTYYTYTNPNRGVVQFQQQAATAGAVAGAGDGAGTIVTRSGIGAGTGSSFGMGAGGGGRDGLTDGASGAWADTIEFYEERDTLMHYAHTRNFRPELVSRITEHLELAMARHRPDELVLSALPRHFKKDVCYSLYRPILNAVPFFTNTESAFISALAYFLRARSYLAGDLMMSKGDIGSEMWFVRSGTVAILRQKTQAARMAPLSGTNENPNSVWIQRKKIAERQPHGVLVLGELSFILATPRCATVKCLTPVQSLVLHRADWDVCVRHYPTSWKVLIQKFAEYVTTCYADLFPASALGASVLDEKSPTGGGSGGVAGTMDATTRRFSFLRSTFIQSMADSSPQSALETVRSDGDDYGWTAAEMDAAFGPIQPPEIDIHNSTEDERRKRELEKQTERDRRALAAAEQQRKANEAAAAAALAFAPSETKLPVVEESPAVGPESVSIKSSPNPSALAAPRSSNSTNSNQTPAKTNPLGHSLAVVVPVTDTPVMVATPVASGASPMPSTSLGPPMIIESPTNAGLTVPVAPPAPTAIVIPTKEERELELLKQKSYDFSELLTDKEKETLQKLKAKEARERAMAVINATRKGLEEEHARKQAAADAVEASGGPSDGLSSILSVLSPKGSPQKSGSLTRQKSVESGGAITPKSQSGAPPNAPPLTPSTTSSFSFSALFFGRKGDTSPQPVKPGASPLSPPSTKSVPGRRMSQAERVALYKQSHKKTHSSLIGGSISLAGSGGSGSGSGGVAVGGKTGPVRYDDDTEFMDVINHPLGLEYFVKFSKSEFNVENIVVCLPLLCSSVVVRSA